LLAAAFPSLGIQLWLFWLAPIIGAALAGFLTRWLYQDELVTVDTAVLKNRESRNDARYRSIRGHRPGYGDIKTSYLAVDMADRIRQFVEHWAIARALLTLPPRLLDATIMRALVSWCVCDRQHEAEDTHRQHAHSNAAKERP